MIKALALFAALLVLSLSCISQNKKENKSVSYESPKLDTVGIADTLLITNSSTPFRERPDINSKQLKEIPSYVILTSFKKVGNYYEVVLNDTTGYIPIAFVNKYRPETTSVNSSNNPTSSSNQTSSSSYSNSSKGCSSRQCSGTTKKGLRCRNTTTNCSARCYLH